MSFNNMGDGIKFWGKNSAFWGGLWSLFFGGNFPGLTKHCSLGDDASAGVVAMTSALALDTFTAFQESLS